MPTGWTSKVEDDKDALTIKNRDEYANVIVSSEPIDPSLDPRQYAEEQGDLLSEFPEYQEFTFEETNVFAGDGGYERVFQWDPKDGLPVTQIQQYYAENGRGYTATATALSSEITRYQDEMQQVLVNTTLIRAGSEPDQRQVAINGLDPNSMGADQVSHRGPATSSATTSAISTASGPEANSTETPTIITWLAIPMMPIAYIMPPPTPHAVVRQTY